MQKLLIVFALVVALTGCASIPATLGTTGAVLEQVGKDWLAVNDLFVEGCRPSKPTIDQASCVKARDLALKMKTAYPLAMDLYAAGVSANDANIAGGAKAIIRSLAVDASALAIKVGLTFVKVK